MANSTRRKPASSVSVKLHLGRTVWQLGPDLYADSLCRQVELAEAWGYGWFFLPETNFVEATPILDPMLLAAAAAQRRN
jgi:alkanesulfonate monooxygenase SsuD/methylene tetrahydromethanopterin reductase-like flavin-dependent oxidoreductase (luciferase family)